MTTAVKIDPDAITIRTELRSGDLSAIIYLHCRLYKEERDFGLPFEAYVAQGVAEFYKQYDPSKDNIWICEHEGKIAGFLVLMHRDNGVAQLRYFLLLPEYRGLGLGKKLMDLYVARLRQGGYRSAYLWTTCEQEAAVSLYKRYGFVLKEEVASNAFGKPLIEQRYELLID